MADLKSSEVYKKLESDIERYLKHEKNFSDEEKLKQLKKIGERIIGITYLVGLEDKRLNAIRDKIHEIERPIIDRLNQKGNKTGDLSIKVDIDVSNALKGLKAVQREARKTIKLLKEVERLKGGNKR